MKEVINNTHTSFMKTTLYNAMCGVIGNAIYEIGKAMPSLD